MTGNPEDGGPSMPNDGIDWPNMANRVVGTILWVPTLALYAFSGLVAPILGVFALWVMGAIWLGIGTRWWHQRSIWYAASPLFAVASWGVAINLGDQLLGWTA